MMRFETPEIEVVLFAKEDIITTSNPTGGSNANQLEPDWD